MNGFKPEIGKWYAYRLETFPEDFHVVEARVIEEVGAGYRMEVGFTYNGVPLYIKYVIPRSKLGDGVILAPHSYYILGRLYAEYGRKTGLKL